MSDISPGTDHDSPSHFDLLGLPREIRDLIYKCALSEPEGLFFRKERTAFEIEHNLFTAFATPEAAADEDAREQNQLKYVCRQLRDETIGLGVEVNDLVFEISDHCDHVDSPCPQCDPFSILEGFLETCSSKRLARIRKITSYLVGVNPICHKDFFSPIFNTEEYLDKAIDSDIIMSFLSNYPRATFNWYLDAYFEDLNQLRRHALTFHLYLTDRDPGDNPFLNECERVVPSMSDQHDWAPDELQILNFKIWPPRSLRIDDESAACETYKDNAEFQETAPDGIGEAVKECKRWIEHSILDVYPLHL